ncbi:hypothetical protein C3K47_07795 [Solitalea longa]|uniref:Uncharacterized protein n=1 Tax=Solitalea longa TaxID=2079460 RepID=A0A2S5A303_9SPHI|nr:hypothetical protein [Solitalea longa]POY36958.1 hypothetical protein C3K47_07795 [Solitalea longa]
MKKILSIILLLGIATLSCRKEDNPKLPDIVSVPVPQVKLGEGASAIIEEPAEFASKVDVGLYFPDKEKPKKIDLMVARNGDYNNVKVFQADITAFPTSVDVTGAKLAQVFGIDVSSIVPGDFFEMRANVVLTNGTVVPGFNSNGIEPYGGDVQNFPGSSLTVTFNAVCPLNLDAFSGSVTVDDPSFWEGSYPVTITLEGENTFRITGWVEDPTATFTMTVDPVNRTINIPKQTVLADFFGYHNYSVEGTGTLDACSTSITINVSNTVDEGSFGIAKIVISK